MSSALRFLPCRWRIFPAQKSDVKFDVVQFQFDNGPHKISLKIGLFLVNKQKNVMQKGDDCLKDLKFLAAVK